MTADDDIEAYLETFQREAIAAGWDQSRWASHLGPLLIGQAQAAYRALSRPKASDFQEVICRALRFALSSC